MTPSIRNLLFGNAVTLAIALAMRWDVGALLWPYWIQSVIVGWYARKRMLTLANFSTDGFTSNGRPIPATEQGKRSTAMFFAFHYGIFHLGYLLFLWKAHAVGNRREAMLLLICGASFVLSQRQTYAAQHAADLRGRPNLGTLMFLPYLRVVPMHLAIIIGSDMSGTGALLFFGALKTVSDMLMDSTDRAIARKSADKAALRAPAPPSAQE